MINKVITFPATRTVYGLPTLESRRVFSEVTSNLDLFEHLYGKPYLTRVSQNILKNAKIEGFVSLQGLQMLCRIFKFDLLCLAKCLCR